MKAFTLGRYQRALVSNPIIVTFNKQKKLFYMGDRRPCACAKRVVCGYTTFPILTQFSSKKFSDDNINDLPPPYPSSFLCGGYVFDLELFTKPVRVGREEPKPKNPRP